MKPKKTSKVLGFILAAVFACFAVSCTPKAKPTTEAATAPGEAAAVNKVENISVTKGEKGAQVAISTTNPVSPLGYFLDDPPRVIIDIPSAGLGEGVSKSYPVNTPPIKEITASSLGSPENPTARVVIALAGETEYEVKKENGKVVVVLGGGAPPAPGGVVTGLPAEEETPAPPEAAVSVPPEAPAEVPTTAEAGEAAPAAPEELPPPETLTPAKNLLDISTRTEGKVVQVVLLTDGAVSGYDVFTLPDPPRIVVDLVGLSSTYPVSRLDVKQGDVAAVRLGKHPDKVRVVVDLMSTIVPYSTVKKADKLVINIGEGAEAMAPPPKAPSVAPAPAPAGPAIEEAPPAPPAETQPATVEKVEEQPAAEVTPEAAPAEEPPEAPPEAPVEVTPEAPAAPTPTAPAEAAPPAAAPEEKYEAVQITAVDFDWTEKKSTVRIGTTGRAKYEVVPNERDRLLSVRIKNATIPANLERSLDTSDFASPVRMVSSYSWSTEATKEVYVTMSLNFTPSYYVVREGNDILVIFDNPAGGKMAAAPTTAEYAAGPTLTETETITEEGIGPGGAQYFGGVEGSVRRQFSGRLVYLDFRRINIVDALGLIAEQAGLNLVVSGKLKGDISLKLEAVPWDQALDIILRTQKLGGVIRGNILRVAPLRQLEEEERKYRESKRRRKIEREPELRIIFVSYADPSDIQSVIENGKMLTPNKGRIEVDKRTSSLLVWDVPEKLDEIEKLVRRLDVETPQVLVEARIVEAESSFTSSLGVNWGIGYHSGAATGNPTGMNFPGTVDVGMGLVSGVSGASSSARTMEGTNVGITLGSITNAVDLDLLLSVAETEGKSKTISSPRILTLDNQQAEISQGLAIPFSTTSAAGTQTEFVDANLKISVTPHVTSDGRIIMEITVQRNSPKTVEGATGPGIDKHEATTQILVKDGETAVIGGIFVIDKGETEARVPYLGKLPFIGWLFRSKSTSDTRKELIIFLTPRIVSGGEQYMRHAASTTLQ